MNILILSCNTGGGHNTSAKALSEELERRGHKSEIVDALAFGSQLYSDLICKSYIEMTKVAPKFFGKVYNKKSKQGELTNEIEEKLGIDLKTPVYAINSLYEKELLEYIEEKKFDTIIACHIYPSQTLTHMYRHKHLHIPSYFINTDYDPTPMIEDIENITVFASHKDVVSGFLSRGVPKEMIIPAGIPVSGRFNNPLPKNVAREKIEGINEDDKIILIMSGSMGFGSSVDTASYILENSDEKTKIIAITGSNTKLKNEMEDKFGETGRVIVLGFTTEVPLYLAACDVLMTKPGGLTTTEAAVMNVPLIHTSPIPGCETANAEFFQKRHMAIKTTTSEEAAMEAVRLVNDSFLCDQIKAAQKNYINPFAARDIIDHILKEKSTS